MAVTREELKKAVDLLPEEKLTSLKSYMAVLQQPPVQTSAREEFFDDAFFFLLEQTYNIADATRDLRWEVRNLSSSIRAIEKHINN